ncbi:hypothetical protein M9H77_14572 [Catharanthus roseus]|uniref:Uncharacterized protein n=1 Tax=Catharanthus roseus TaxID=4058 RepID=A0ACC0BNK9_CATRO|nr:hypothetical protein M9H77_14572 [Catharanthus roseus]
MPGRFILQQVVTELSSGSSALVSNSNLSDLRSFLDLAIPKIETDRFDGKSNFLMWRRKMKAVFVQNKIAPTICSPEEYPESWKGEILKEKLGDAHSCLTLHLTDNVLREIDEKDNAFEIWTKLEKLYLGKSLSNKIYLKE